MGVGIGDSCREIFKILNILLLISQYIFCLLLFVVGDRGSTVVKVLCYKLEGGWFDPSWYRWIFH